MRRWTNVFEDKNFGETLINQMKSLQIENELILQFCVKNHLFNGQRMANGNSFFLPFF